MHCKSKAINKSRNIINHGPYKSHVELGTNEVNRVSLPGDAGYEGCMLAKGGRVMPMVNNNKAN
jgi:hypothetical protein